MKEIKKIQVRINYNICKCFVFKRNTIILSPSFKGQWASADKDVTKNKAF